MSHTTHLPEDESIDEIERQLLDLIRMLTIEARCELRAKAFELAMDAVSEDAKDGDVDWFGDPRTFQGIDLDALETDYRIEKPHQTLWKYAWDAGCGDLLEHLMSAATPDDDREAAEVAAKKFVSEVYEATGNPWADPKPEAALQELRRLRWRAIRQLTNALVRSRDSDGDLTEK